MELLSCAEGAARNTASSWDLGHRRYLLRRSFIHEQLKTINGTDIITVGQNEERRYLTNPNVRLLASPTGFEPVLSP